jgi:hypothetical protein
MAVTFARIDSQRVSREHVPIQVGERASTMRKRYVKRLGLVGIVALAIVLGGCGNSKGKGSGGYGYAPSTHHQTTQPLQS